MVLPSRRALEHLLRGRVPLTYVSALLWASGAPGAEPLVFAASVCGIVLINGVGGEGRVRRACAYWDRDPLWVHVGDVLTHWLPLKWVLVNGTPQAPSAAALGGLLALSRLLPTARMYGFESSDDVLPPLHWSTVLAAACALAYAPLLRLLRDETAARRR